MLYRYVPMQEEYANKIVNSWQYDGIYSFYDMKADEDDLKLFTDKTNWKNIIFAVLNNKNELIGWSSYYMEGEIIWLALGLKPELTGKGLGKQFVSDCIQFIKSKSHLNQSIIKLEVALFNQRAIKVYKRVGFAESDKITKSTHIGKLDFLQMTKTCSNLLVQFPDLFDYLPVWVSTGFPGLYNVLIRSPIFTKIFQWALTTVRVGLSTQKMPKIDNLGMVILEDLGVTL